MNVFSLSFLIDLLFVYGVWQIIAGIMLIGSALLFFMVALVAWFRMKLNG